MVEAEVPDGFLRLSEAIEQLREGIWGGFRRPTLPPIIKLLPQFKNASLGFSPWKEEAGSYVTAAAIKGKLSIYVGVGQATDDNLKPEPVLLPSSVVGRLMRARRSLHDHAIRPTLKTSWGDKKLLALLLVGLLLVRSEEFNRWYRSERRKGKWASQRSRLKRREGRPSKQTDALRNAVISVLREGKYSIAALRRRLIANGHADIPSPDTLSRIVDQLSRETADPDFLRPKRSRRKQAQ